MEAMYQQIPSGDYPREHGGTLNRLSYGHTSKGLSPRARGNPVDKASRKSQSGTIPASTGEPRATAAAISEEWDYPREHGGT